MYPNYTHTIHETMQPFNLISLWKGQVKIHILHVFLILFMKNPFTYSCDSETVSDISRRGYEWIHVIHASAVPVVIHSTVFGIFPNPAHKNYLHEEQSRISKKRFGAIKLCKLTLCMLKSIIIWFRSEHDSHLNRLFKNYVIFRYMYYFFLMYFTGFINILSHQHWYFNIILRLIMQYENQLIFFLQILSIGWLAEP